MQVERKTWMQLFYSLIFLLVIAIGSVILIISIRDVIGDINEVKNKKTKSLQYVDELRQSSDDLTRMARLYVLTQDTLYFSYFNDILKIRDGLIKRPLDYSEIYWDYVLADGQIPRPGIDAVPLIDLMKEFSLEDEAASYFIKAKNSSDDLVEIEEEAFNAVVGIFKDSLEDYSISALPDPGYAIELLHNREYHLAKAKIMRSIQDFNNFVNDQAKYRISELNQKYLRLIVALIVTVLFVIAIITLMVLIVSRNLRNLPLGRKIEMHGSDYSLKNMLREVKKAWVLSMASVLFSILIIVGFIAAGQIIKEEIEENLEQSLNTILETTQATILNWMSDVELTMDQLIHQPGSESDIRSTMLNKNSKRSADLENKLRLLLSHLSYYGYIISEDDGNVIVSNIESMIGKNISDLDDDQFIRSLQLPELNIVNSLPKGSGTDPTYNSLIKFGHSYFTDDDYRGSIIILMDPQKRFTNVLQGGRMGSSGESYAFNRYGEMISESRFYQDLYNIGLLEEGENSLLNIVIRDPGGDMTAGFIPPLQRDKQQFTFMASNALKGYNGINVKGYNDYRGVKVVGVWRWIEKYGFGVTTEIDHSEAFRTYNLIVNLGLYSLIFIVALILTLTIIFILNRLKQNTLSLRISKQKLLLENTLESLTHPFYVVDAKDYSLLLANSAAKKLGDTCNNTCYALTHKRGEPCDSKEDPCPLKIIKETKKPVVLEHTHFDPEGNPKIVEVSGYPIFDEHGEVIQMIEYSIDITDRKKAEQDLLAANQRFEAIVNNLADALVIINERGIIEFFSPSAEKLFQYKGVEVMGENVKILTPSPHYENHDGYLSRYFKTGEARVVGIEREVDAKRKDGSLFPARLMISEVKTANHHFFVGLIGDLTERKLAEKQLKTQAAAMESAENAIVITNASGFIQWVNPAFDKLTGYSPDEVIGKLPNILKSGKHDDAFYKNMWETILAGKVWQGEIINKKKNDELYYEEMTITPVLDEKEQLSQFVAIKQDISERKRLEEIMKKAKERMEDELNVAKDIQMSMLPLIFPAFPQRGEIDIYADLIPAREVGGDFYDFYFLDENHICFVVGDVSGKGVPAALMMAVTKTLLKSRAGNDKSTASILTHVNNEIAKDNDTYMFITVFIAILNTSTGELVYSNAGHNPSFILSPGNKPPVKLSDLHGPVVGAMEQMSYTESSVFINKDDIVVAYTDGITEAQNKNDELYSDEKFIEFLQNWEYTTPGHLVKEIIKSVKKHEDGAEQFDDITVLVVQYCQEPNTMISARISFTILNKIEEIDTATGHFEEFCEKNDVDMAVIPKFNIVFDELLNNIITYGYKDDIEHEIDFEIELKGERMVINIADDGIPFNPFTQSPPDTMLSVEERGIGGLGIHIVTNLMDEYTYQRNIDKNVITLIKYNVKS